MNQNILKCYLAFGIDKINIYNNMRTNVSYYYYYRIQLADTAMIEKNKRIR